MRVALLTIKVIAIVCSITLGVVSAQQNARQPAAGTARGTATGQPVAPGGQPAAGNPQSRGGATGQQPAGDLPAVGTLQVRPSQPAAVDEATFRQQVSYIFGRQMGEGLRESQIQVDLQSLMTGVDDGLKNAPPKWGQEQLAATMERFEREMQQKGAARHAELMAKNKREQDAFLAKNRTQQGVQVTPSGLQYKVIQQGNGPSPTVMDSVRCNYRGQLLDGTEFDSSQRQGGPQVFPVGRTPDGRGIISGWSEALQKMKVGDKWQLFVPGELAYGVDPPPRSGIEPGAMLVFEIELLEIVRQ